MNYEKDTISLTTDDGEEINFSVIAGINLEGEHAGFYYIVRPENENDVPGLDDDEALVLKVTNNQGDEWYNLITDDDILEQVFAEYNKLLDEQ